MGILLAVAVMVVAVASWFIAASLRTQIRQNAAELEQARKQITAECAEQAGKRLMARGHDQAGLAGFYEMVQQQISETAEHLARHDDEMRRDQARAAEQEAATTDEAHRALMSSPPHRDKRLSPNFNAAGFGVFRGRRNRQPGRAERRRHRHQGEATGSRRACELQARRAGDRDYGSLRQRGGAERNGRRRPLRLCDGIDAAHHPRAGDGRVVEPGQPCRLSRGDRGGGGFWPRLSDDDDRGRGICAEQPAAADTLPPLYESFLHELPADMLFHDSAHQSSDRFYLLWSSRNGQSLERRLEMLLRGCPQDSGKPAPGLDELRGLLLALHHAGPGTLRVGPLVVIRTDRELVGTVLAATEASLLDGDRALPAPGECRALLRNVGRDRLADLGGWADSHS